MTEAMQGKNLLIVEDERPIRDMLQFALQREGFLVRGAEDAQQARVQMAQGMPDLILMDWMMPGTSGVELARELKAAAQTKDVPIIMLTARGEEDDKVRGLNIGCDDYITKPFSNAELIARIHAVLRRSQPGGADESIKLDDLLIDVASHRVSVNDNTVQLGPTEYRLLLFFASHAERVYTREQLLDRVWGQNVYVEERTVDVHIRRLRKALAPYGKDNLIQTVRGAGYRLSIKPE